MDNIRKAAILMLSLEKPLAAEVLSQLPKNRVEQLTLEIARLEEVTKDQQDAVIEEFYKLAGQRVPIERGGLEVADALLQQSLGPDDAGVILENVRQSM